MTVITTMMMITMIINMMINKEKTFPIHMFGKTCISIDFAMLMTLWYPLHQPLHWDALDSIFPPFSVISAKETKIKEALSHRYPV